MMHDHGEKMQEVNRDSLGDQTGSWGGIEGKQEACGAECMCISKQEATEQTTVPKKTKTSDHKLMQSADLQSEKSKHETSQKTPETTQQQGKAHCS